MQMDAPGEVAADRLRQAGDAPPLRCVLGLQLLQYLRKPRQTNETLESQQTWKLAKRVHGMGGTAALQHWQLNVLGMQPCEHSRSSGRTGANSAAYGHAKARMPQADLDKGGALAGLRRHAAHGKVHQEGVAGRRLRQLLVLEADGAHHLQRVQPLPRRLACASCKQFVLLARRPILDESACRVQYSLKVCAMLKLPPAAGAPATAPRLLGVKPSRRKCVQSDTRVSTISTAAQLRVLHPSTSKMGGPAP